MSTTFKSPFILVDGSSYLFRAYHALPPLTTSKGQATGAIYGVISMLRKLRTDYQSTHIAVVFDTKGKTFRHDLYPEYKANRAVMPEDLAEQIAPLHAIIQAMGFPLVAIPGIEADDVIGTLAIEAQKHQWPVLISTGDKDMAQLVNQSVTLVNTMTEKILDINGVIEKFGIRPEQMIDYLTLMGDSIDNVPGIPGVGPKTAVKWLQTYGSLDAIIAHADHINGKVGEQLRLTLPQLPLLKTLVTIKSDCKLPVMLEELMLKPSNQESLIHWFRELEFKRWLSEADNVRHSGNAAGVVRDPGITEKQYHTVLTEAEFDRWLNRLEKASLFAIDIETTSLDCTDAEIVGLSFAMTPYEAAYVPLAHCYIGAPVQCDRDTILKKLKPLLENPDLKKVGQHIKYDMNVLANYGITLRGIAYDTMLESYILNSTANRHDLETLALRHLDEKTVSFQELAGKGAKQITFDYVAIEQAAPYAAEDADITLRLHHVLWPQLQKIPALADIFNTIELPLIPVLSRMECRGVLIDKARLKEQGIVIKERVQQLTTQAFHLAGSEFNL
ncbi:MAG: polymerase, partial [Gammaproteobacteria bacterium]|nr:polymerase [Gammaproteobacteria bacterium]